jgi:hypothetical protein
MLKGPADVVDWCIWNSFAFKCMQPMVGGLTFQVVSEQFNQLFTMLYTVSIGTKLLLMYKVFTPKYLTKNLKLSVIACTNHYMAIMC